MPALLLPRPKLVVRSVARSQTARKSSARLSCRARKSAKRTEWYTLLRPFFGPMVLAFVHSASYFAREVCLVVFRRLFRRQAEPDVQLERSLEKTRRGVFSEITRLFDRSELDDELYEDLEMLLLQADVGVEV